VNFNTPTPGASYTYSYDSMYRLSGMQTSGGTTVVNNVTYNAANQLLTMTFGPTTETRGYNSLNQLTSISAQNVPYGTIENLTYNYPAGTNNGKIGSTYNAVSGETVTYTYDSLNRLLTANGSGWGQQYGFDGIGNLLSKTVTAGSGPSLSISVNTANTNIRRIVGLRCSSLHPARRREWPSKLDLRSSRVAEPRPPSPEQPEASAMPEYYRLGLHQYQ
jgi:hypothetical protein